jgi:sialic acid synthase SpsE
MRVLNGTGHPDIETQAAAVNNARRRIIAVRDLAPGTRLEESDLIPLRANIGLEVAEWDSVVGAILINSVAQGAPITAADLSS